MKELNDKIMNEVTGGAATHQEVYDMVHTCPFCLGHNVGGGLADTKTMTGWWYCRNCKHQYEVYLDENAVYENATDVYTKRGVDTDGKLIEPKDFPDVQALWR